MPCEIRICVVVLFFDAAFPKSLLYIFEDDSKETYVFELEIDFILHIGPEKWLSNGKEYY